MALTADDIIVPVQEILFDETGVRWPKATLLRDLGEAQRLLVSLEPRAGRKAVIAQLEAGKSRQELPEGYRRIVDMPRNLLSVTLPPVPVEADLLVAESLGETGVRIYRVTTSAITALCTIPYADAREPASASWLKFDAVPFGSDWYCVLAGDGTTYGGDLFKITNAGTATNQTADLGVTWTSELYGPNSIVSATAGMAVGMNQAPSYLFSADGTTWGAGIALPEASTFGYRLGGSGGKFSIIIDDTDLFASSDGLTYVLPGKYLEDDLAYGTAVFGDSGVMIQSNNRFMWVNAAGGSSPEVEVSVGGTYVLAHGNAHREFGYTPMRGAFDSTRAHLLLRDSTGQCAVGSGVSPASFAAGGGATVAKVATAYSGRYGYGCYDLGAGNYVVVLNTGIYRTTDFVTFTMSHAPTGYETIIGAGGLARTGVTAPPGWA